MNQEEQLIAQLQKRFNPHGHPAGIGDDAACLPGSWRHRKTVVTVDTLCEGRHFDLKATPQSIGRKLVNISFSDLAAMAARPSQVLVSLALPPKRMGRWVQSLTAGIESAVQAFHAQVTGGDTVVSDRMVLTSIAIGICWKNPVYRHGARPGDYLWTTGCFGWSLETGHHLSFRPRLAESRWLLRHMAPRAMTDASDGLARSLQLLTLEQGLGARIEADAIPLREAGPSSRERLQRALFDGEDFELVLAAPRPHPRVLKQYQRKFGHPLSCVGQVTRQPELMLQWSASQEPIEGNSYDHFRT